MRKIFFLFFIIIANCFSISAQEDPTKVHALVEQKAGPKEGMQAFFQNFITAFNAPNVPKEIKELSTRLKFVVETDGTFSNIEELKEELDQEVGATFESIEDKSDTEVEDIFKYQYEEMTPQLQEQLDEYKSFLEGVK